MTNQNTTIQISRDTKKELDKRKVIPEETYENVIKRVLDVTSHLAKTL